MHNSKDFLSQMYRTDKLTTIETDLQLIESTDSHYNYVLAGGVLIAQMDYIRTRRLIND